MSSLPVEVRRPQRWDEPLGDKPLSDSEIDWILSHPPFSRIDASAFPSSTPLREILRNDTRIVRSISGDVIFRAGDYGTSAFFIVGGRIRVSLDAAHKIAEEIQGNVTHKELGFVGALAQLWTNSRIPEARDYPTDPEDARVLSDGLFVQDVPRILDRHRAALLEAGDFFGETAALARAPRTATVFAESEAVLLELRWQGLRDICRRSPEIQQHIDALYRERGLLEQLRNTPIFQHLSEEERQRVADATGFETYGDRDWAAGFKSLAKRGTAARLENEPIIAEEGHYANGLILIRNGFARVSQQFGSGHRTLRYLGRGQIFGLEEVVEGWRQQEPAAYRCSIRAVGYVDILLVPTRTLEETLLPSLPTDLLPDGALDTKPGETREATSALQTAAHNAFLEQLVDGRYFNGTAAMVIDIERCTHCDDCVRACAAAHDGNPRFIRHGEQVGRFIIANACMHCVDPVCMIGCPTGAIHRVALEGQVAINDKTCIGCGTCANNCPYDNIRMTEARDPNGAILLGRETGTPILKATKCDLCVDQKLSPACEYACPHDALKRVDLSSSAKLVELLQP